jgi:hydrogenase maturation factor
MNRSFHISTVFFHLEGVLVRADERPLKSALGCPDTTSLPEFIRGIRDKDRRKRVMAESVRLDQVTSAAWSLQPGAKRIFSLIGAKNLAVGIFSRHGQKTVDLFLKRAMPALQRHIRLRIFRNELLTCGRSRNPFRRAAKIMRVPAGKTLVVSADSKALGLAAAAGALTVLVSSSPAVQGRAPCPDFRISRLSQLPGIIRLGIPLPAGKLPNELLKDLLGELIFEDPALLINPGVGEDIAAVDVSGDEVLVLKSDPITFATEAIGQYAVLVNANDIATAGAVPRWLLTTLLFPVGSTPSMIRYVVHELQEFCRKWGITLCGGHTEITDAVTRPVISGMMAGSVRRKDLIDKRNIRPGDRLLMTKAAAVEGTAIIARECVSRLRSLGMAEEEIHTCRTFLARISIIPEARIAARCPGTSAMHDVTEGGIATALEELAAAGGCRLRVDLGRVPVFPETRNLCRLLDVNPLGLIGSGSLLICCRPKHASRLEADLRREGIAVTRIGEVGQPGGGVQAFKDGRPARWPSFEVDEIARLFARRQMHSNRTCGVGSRPRRVILPGSPGRKG